MGFFMRDTFRKRLLRHLLITKAHPKGRLYYARNLCVRNYIKYKEKKLKKPGGVLITVLIKI